MSTKHGPIDGKILFTLDCRTNNSHGIISLRLLSLFGMSRNRASHQALPRCINMAWRTWHKATTRQRACNELFQIKWGQLHNSVERGLSHFWHSRLLRRALIHCSLWSAWRYPRANTLRKPRSGEWNTVQERILIRPIYSSILKAYYRGAESLCLVNSQKRLLAKWFPWLITQQRVGWERKQSNT